MVESLGKFDVKPMGIEFAKLLQMLFDLLDITKMENLTFDNYRLTESLTDSTIRSLLKLICLCDQEDLMAVEKEFLTIYLKPFSYACDRYKSITFANLSNIGTSAHGDFSMFFSAIEQLQRLSHLRISTQMLAVMSEGL